MDIEAVIAGLGERFTADEAAIAERMLREHGGSVPDRQLIEEVGLAIAIHRRSRNGHRVTILGGCCPTWTPVAATGSP